MTGKLKLDSNIHDNIKALCASGDKLSSAGRYEDAIIEYKKAWKLVPEPKNDWEAATWII